MTAARVLNAYQTDDAVALPLCKLAGLENVAGFSSGILEPSTVMDFQVHVIQIDSTFRGEIFRLR